MKLLLLITFASTFFLSSPTFSSGIENNLQKTPNVQGEMRKFIFHETPKVIDKLNVIDMDGSEVNLMADNFNYLILNFWATWCAPCVEEMPSLNQLQAELDGSKIQIVTVATGRNNPKKIKNFFEEYNLDNLPKLRDPKSSLALNFGIFGLPASILIAPNGYEVARLVGPIDWVKPEVISFFTTLTEQR